MALDFHNNSTNEYLFALNDKELGHLETIFKQFTQHTGITIDPYEDMLLNVALQKTLVKQVDAYIDQNDLNQNKQQTLAIMEFRTRIEDYTVKNIDLKLLGD